MHIAYISGTYIPDRGADSVHITSMCQAFSRLGHSVTLYARPGQEPVDDDFAFYGVAPCFRIEKIARPQVRVWGAIVNAWRTSRLVTRDGPDLLYAREAYGLGLAARTGTPFVYETHWKPKHRAERAFFRWLFQLPNLRGVVFISERLRAIYKQEFPWLPDTKLIVAHDAANPVPELALDSPRPAGARLQVGYVGGFLPGYGIEILVQLARSKPQFDFHVVGGREPAVQAWRRQTSDVTNLTFHGFVHPGQLSKRYRDFDVVLAPYQETTRHIDWISPMKLFEYMAHGKAIVCADFPVMREILEHGRDALLVPPADLKAYGEALEQLSEPGFRSSLANNARAKLEREFTWLRRAERICAQIGAST